MAKNKHFRTPVKTRLTASDHVFAFFCIQPGCFFNWLLLIGVGFLFYTYVLCVRIPAVVTNLDMKVVEYTSETANRDTCVPVGEGTTSTDYNLHNFGVRKSEKTVYAEYLCTRVGHRDATFVDETGKTYLWQQVPAPVYSTLNEGDSVRLIWNGFSVVGVEDRLP